MFECDPESKTGWYTKSSLRPKKGGISKIKAVAIVSLTVSNRSLLLGSSSTPAANNPKEITDNWVLYHDIRSSPKHPRRVRNTSENTVALL